MYMYLSDTLSICVINSYKFTDAVINNIVHKRKTQRHTTLT